MGSTEEPTEEDSCGNKVCDFGELTSCPSDCEAELIEAICDCVKVAEICDGTCADVGSLDPVQFPGCNAYAAAGICGGVIPMDMRYTEMCAWQCPTDEPTLTPTMNPTINPTSTPTPEPTSDPTPESSTLQCGSSVSGSTRGRSSQIGHRSGEVTYEFTAESSTSVTFDLCDSTYDTFLRIFDDSGAEI